MRIKKVNRKHHFTSSLSGSWLGKLAVIGFFHLGLASHVWAGAADLNGGQTRINVPEGTQNPTFSIKNKTGAKIADFTITVEGSPVRITGANIVDDNRPGEDWDVDDNGDGTLTTGAGGESVTAPGAAPGGEGTDPAAAGANGNADNQQAAGASARLEESGRNQPIDPNRTVELDLTFDNPPGKGMVIVIQPTSGRGREIVDAKTALVVKEEGLIVGGVAELAFDAGIGVVSLLAITTDESTSFNLGEIKVSKEFHALAMEMRNARWKLQLQATAATKKEN